MPNYNRMGPPFPLADGQAVEAMFTGRIPEPFEDIRTINDLVSFADPEQSCFALSASEQLIATMPAGSQGVIRKFGFINGGTALQYPEDARVKIYPNIPTTPGVPGAACDMSAYTPAIELYLSEFCLQPRIAGQAWQDYASYTSRGNKVYVSQIAADDHHQMSGVFAIPIPYSDGITMTVTGSTAVAPGDGYSYFYPQVKAQVGSHPWPLGRQSILRSCRGTFTVERDGEYTLLPEVTCAGQLIGVGFDFRNAGGGDSWCEAMWNFDIDGVLAKWFAGASEDFIENGYMCTAGVMIGEDSGTPRNDYYTADPLYTWGGYRWFYRDPVRWDSTFKIRMKQKDMAVATSTLNVVILYMTEA